MLFIIALLGICSLVSAGGITVTSSSFGGGGWIAATSVKSGDGTRVYVGGGYSMAPCSLASVNALVYVVQPAIPNTFATLLGGGRFEMAAAAANSATAVFYVGGVNSTKQVVDSVDRIDGSIATRDVHRLSVARAAITAANVGSYAVFAGGARNVVFNCGGPTTTTFSNPTAAVDLYNTNTGVWSTANLQQPRHSATSAVSNNRLYISGTPFSLSPRYPKSTTNMFVAVALSLWLVRSRSLRFSVNNRTRKYHSCSQTLNHLHYLLDALMNRTLNI